MVYCKYCSNHVSGILSLDGDLFCELCGCMFEDFKFSTDVKNAAGQSQASGNIVKSVQSEISISSSHERRIRMARDEFMNLNLKDH